MRILIANRFSVLEVLSNILAEQFDLDLVKIISIVDPEDGDIDFCLPDDHVLRLKFHDVDSSYAADSPNRVVFFDKKMAQKIKDFISGKEEIVLVHCHAGISRSSGVAAALSHKFISKEACNDIFTNRRYLPNMLVFRTLLNLLMGAEIPFSRPPQTIESEDFFD